MYGNWWRRGLGAMVIIRVWGIVSDWGLEGPMRACQPNLKQMEHICNREIYKEWVFRRYKMHQRTRFCSGLRDFPPQMAWIITWLSEWIMKCLLVWPSDIAWRRPNSMATNSAHLILWLFDFHPSQSLITSQFQSWEKSERGHCGGMKSLVLSGILLVSV